MLKSEESVWISFITIWRKNSGDLEMTISRKRFEGNTHQCTLQNVIILGIFRPPLQKFFVKLIYSITLVNKLIWRNFCKKTWEKREILPHPKKYFVKTNFLLSDSSCLVKPLLSRNFAHKGVRVECWNYGKFTLKHFVKPTL